MKESSSVALETTSSKEPGLNSQREIQTGWDNFRSSVSDSMTSIRDLGRERFLGASASVEARDPNKSYLDLSHNDYLGLRSDPEFQLKAKKNASKEPIGSGASRLLGGQFSVFDLLEKEFSEFKKCQSSLYFSTGYAANQALMVTISKVAESVSVFSDELNHASLIDGLSLSKLPRDRKIIYPHLNVEILEELLKQSNSEINFIVTESIFSMDGDVAPLKKLQNLANQYQGVLIIDEAHAVGCYGEFGSGMISEQGISHDKVISVNTCGKALAVQGAFVCGPEWFRTLLINQARSFIYSTAPSPFIAAALRESISYVKTLDERRANLREISRFAHKLSRQAADKAASLPARQQLRGLRRETMQQVAPGDGFGRFCSHIIPYIVGEEAETLELANKLNSQGIRVSAIRPPTVPCLSSRLRISLNAKLGKSQILEIFTVIGL